MDGLSVLSLDVLNDSVLVGGAVRADQDKTKYCCMSAAILTGLVGSYCFQWLHGNSSCQLMIAGVSGRPDVRLPRRHALHSGSPSPFVDICVLSRSL